MRLQSPLTCVPAGERYLVNPPAGNYSLCTAAAPPDPRSRPGSCCGRCANVEKPDAGPGRGPSARAEIAGWTLWVRFALAVSSVVAAESALLRPESRRTGIPMASWGSRVDRPQFDRTRTDLVFVLSTALAALRVSECDRGWAPSACCSASLPSCARLARADGRASRDTRAE